MEENEIQEVITPLTVLDTASLHLVQDPTIITDAQIITESQVLNTHIAVDPSTIQVLLPIGSDAGVSNIPFSIADIVNQTIKGNEIDEEDNIQISDEELEDQKKLIYNHPMLPLVHLFFEKCEHATQLCELRDFDEEPTLAENFPGEVAIYINAKEGLLQTDNPELDDLMLKAIKVLQIHLLELEKVRELCKDFCCRYITCLKSKLQNEQLLHVEGVDDDLDPNGMESPQVEDAIEVCSEVILGEAEGVEGTGTIYQMVQTPQGVVAQPVSFIEPVQKIHTIQKKRKILKSEQGEWPAETTKKTGKTKRGVLPKAATQIMKTWLFQHIIHPYPTEDEKRNISLQTNLSMLQVNNWFINARRRILTPMMESNQALNISKNLELHKPSKKVNRTPSRNSNSWLKATKVEEVKYEAQEIDYAADSIVLPPGVALTTDGQIISLQGTIDDNNSIVVVSTEPGDDIM